MLTAQAPGDLDAALLPAQPIPVPPAVVSVGDPASLLRRRPDIRAAERHLAEDNAVVGQRIADFFPKVSLLGNVGFGSTDPSTLFEARSISTLIAPTLQWSPLDFGRTQAKVDLAKAQRDEAMATYQSTVLAALEDAETSLSRYGSQRDGLNSLTRVKASADRAAAMMDIRVRGGTASTLDVLDTERQRIAAAENVVQAKAQLTKDYVALQKSLGLGWNEVAN
jgi:outer membrane protein TolC